MTLPSCCIAQLGHEWREKPLKSLACDGLSARVKRLLRLFGVRFRRFFCKMTQEQQKPADFCHKQSIVVVDLGPCFAYTRGLTGRLAFRLRLHLLLGTPRI